jgi:hypothetical protein
MKARWLKLFVHESESYTLKTINGESANTVMKSERLK